MAYSLEFTSQAKKQIAKLDAKQKALIKSWFKKNLQECENPRAIAGGKDLEGVKGGWRWRIGSYRVLATIADEVITVTVFKVGHRREIYRRR